MIRIILLMVVAGIVGAIIARAKGRNPAIWFLLSAILPVLVIAVALLPSVIAQGINKKCPHCAEVIKEDATVCKYCGMGV
ncbi:MAG TPA: zinc ribbon domain-containing protein [Bacteroidia bacterium]|nr:zinc ribbon domain-containing protein [Bacteroidia bacterium]